MKYQNIRSGPCCRTALFGCYSRIPVAVGIWLGPRKVHRTREFAPNVVRFGSTQSNASRFLREECAAVRDLRCQLGLAWNASHKCRNVGVSIQA